MGYGKKREGARLFYICRKVDEIRISHSRLPPAFLTPPTPPQANSFVLLILLSLNGKELGFARTLLSQCKVHLEKFSRK